MSVLGTGVAAGVAQTSQQAQQAAEARSVREQRQRIRRVRDTADPSFQVLEEAEQVETDTRIDDRSDRDAPRTPTNGPVEKKSEPEPEPDEAAPIDEAEPDDQDGRNLYRHLDVQA